MKKILLAIIIALCLIGCSNEPIEHSKYESSSLGILKNRQHDFMYNKKIIVKNMAMDEIFIEVEGKCTDNRKGDQLKITCMVNENAYLEYDIILTSSMAVISITDIK